MAESYVSDATKGQVTAGFEGQEDPYRSEGLYISGNGGSVAESTQYIQRDVAHNFVGGNYTYENYYSSAASGQYPNGYGYGHDPVNQTQMNQGEYTDSSQYEQYTGQDEFSAPYSQDSRGAADQHPSYHDSTNEVSGNAQVDQQNYYSQTDQSNTESSAEGRGRRELNGEGHSPHRGSDKRRPRSEREDPRYASESSTDSYRRRRRRSRSRSRSHGKRSRRSHSYRRRRSRSRSRSDSRGRRRERHRRHHRRHRSRSSSASRRERRESRSRVERPRESEREREPRDVGQDLMEKAKMLRSNEIEKKRMKDIEEAQRDDLTVLVANMNLSVDERDIYELFSEHAGKVRDIQCVRDSRSGRSKGIAYVEFYTQEAVIKALSLTGMSLKGQGIRVQSSQAEKNRAAKAAKQVQDNALKESDNPTTIVVSNLVGVLSHLNEAELNQLFSPFGNIVDVTVVRDDNGEPRGYAYIRFKRWTEAKEALNVMNGFDVSGQQIKVTYATTRRDQKSRLNSLLDVDMERLDDDDAGLISGSNIKIALMKKLQQRQPYNSCNIVLSNMYTNEDYADNEGFLDEIEEDVREECSKYGRVADVYLNRKQPDGKVYVKFKNNTDTENAYKSLQGRYFAGNTIHVSYISDDQYKSVTGSGSK